MDHKGIILYLMLLIVGCTLALAYPTTAAPINQSDLISPEATTTSAFNNACTGIMDSIQSDSVITGITEAPSAFRSTLSAPAADERNVPSAENFRILPSLWTKGKSEGDKSFLVFENSLDLLKDTFIASSALFRGGVTLISWSPGFLQEITTPHTITGRPPGSQYVVIKADGSNKIFEIKEIFHAEYCLSREMDSGSIITLAQTGIPTTIPITLPLMEPTPEPTSLPTIIPITLPLMEPTLEPTSLPTIIPITLPLMEPTPEPTSLPTIIPITLPLTKPTNPPLLIPITIPIKKPTIEPTRKPTTRPTTESIPNLETFGAESNPTGNPLGGGKGYLQVFEEDDPRISYIVHSTDEFLDALARASPSDVIYIPEKVSIDLTGIMGTAIPEGITLASNRGVNGSPGGRISQERVDTDPKSGGGRSKSMLYIAGDHVRITGLRLEGPDKTPLPVHHEGLAVRDGIRVYDRNYLEVDNCELYGWSNGGVDLVFPNGGYAYVHHNHFHHIQTEGMGYAVVMYGGRALIEGNSFDYVKNPVAGGGLAGEGYEARYNIVNHTTSRSHSFDIHPYANPYTGHVIAGSMYKIHHNTVRETSNYAVLLSGIPLEGVWIDHNKFQWRIGIDGSTYPPVVQNMGVGNVYMTRNLIGTPEVLYEEGPIYYINDKG